MSVNYLSTVCVWGGSLECPNTTLMTFLLIISEFRSNSFQTLASFIEQNQFFKLNFAPYCFPTIYRIKLTFFLCFYYGTNSSLPLDSSRHQSFLEISHPSSYIATVYEFYIINKATDTPRNCAGILTSGTHHGLTTSSPIITSQNITPPALHWHHTYEDRFCQ